MYVPASKAGLKNHGWAMVSGEIKSISKYGIRISLPNGNLSNIIGVNLVRKKLGILIVTIGDYSTEETLLKPLTKSILQYSRLLCSDDCIKTIFVRSLKELEYYWKLEHSIVSHLVLVGHGEKNALLFGGDWVNPNDLNKILDGVGKIVEGKQIISLCCKTGSAEFGSVISSKQICEIFVGPSGSVHAAYASQFYQTFMVLQLLNGYSVTKSYDWARIATPGLTEFNLWRKTVLGAKPNKKQVLIKPKAKPKYIAKPKTRNGGKTSFNP